jgi:hypothetical protein
VLRGKTLHPRLPQLHQTEFGGNEESIERDEQQRTDKGDNLNQEKGLRQRKVVSIECESYVKVLSRHRRQDCRRLARRAA